MSQLHKALSLAQLTRDLEDLLGESPDVIRHDWRFGETAGIIIYIEGLADPRLVVQSVQRLSERLRGDTAVGPDNAYSRFRYDAITEGKVEESDELNVISTALLVGNTVVFLDGWPKALIAGTESLKQRQVEETSSQSVVRGSWQSMRDCCKVAGTIVLLRSPKQHARRRPV